MTGVMLLTRSSLTQLYCHVRDPGLLPGRCGNRDGAREDRASLSLGLFLADRETETRIDAESLQPGTDVDLEKDLGSTARIPCSRSTPR